MDNEINGVVLNLNNIIDFIFNSDNEKCGDSEITELYSYDGDSDKLSLTTKQLRELKSHDFTPHQSIRYDLVRIFIDKLLDLEDEEITFGQAIVINTMLKENLISEIKE